MTAEPIGESRGQRTVAARVGVAALNLLFPGLGLLRIGRWKSGLCFMAAPFALIALITFGLGFVLISHAAVLFALSLAIMVFVAMFAVPIVMTWRHGKRRRPLRWWSRWYAIAALCLIADLLLNQAAVLSRQFYRLFYAPSSSMAPTLLEGEKFVVGTGRRGPIERGMPIVFQATESARVYRVAAIAGDRIAMRGGVPIINGVAASWQRRGVKTVEGERMAAWAERLPGEATDHWILNSEPAPFDNFAEVVVPKGHVFVLGDNRGRSADSRIPADAFGVGMVPESAIIGRPRVIYWSRNHDRIGDRLDR